MVRSAVLFDLDGTLWNAPIDWQGIRDEMGLRYTGEPILEQIEKLPGDRRGKALSVLHERESRGVSEGALIDGATDLCRALRDAGVLCGLVSNNARKNVDEVLRLTGLQFDVVLSRDDVPTKPAPNGFLTAMRRIQVEAEHAAVVGDTHLDAVAAHAAGVRRIILVSPPAWSAELIPQRVVWRFAADLTAVRRCLMADLTCSRPVPASTVPNEEMCDHVQ